MIFRIQNILFLALLILVTSCKPGSRNNFKETSNPNIDFSYNSSEAIPYQSFEITNLSDPGYRFNWFIKTPNSQYDFVPYVFNNNRISFGDYDYVDLKLMAFIQGNELVGEAQKRIYLRKRILQYIKLTSINIPQKEGNYIARIRTTKDNTGRRYEYVSAYFDVTADQIFPFQIEQFERKREVNTIPAYQGNESRIEITASESDAFELDFFKLDTIDSTFKLVSSKEFNIKNNNNPWIYSDTTTSTINASIGWIAE